MKLEAESRGTASSSKPRKTASASKERDNSAHGGPLLLPSPNSPAKVKRLTPTLKEGAANIQKPATTPKKKDEFESEKNKNQTGFTSASLKRKKERRDSEKKELRGMFI